MLIVRGENIYPSAVEGILRGTPGVGQEYRIIVSREQAMDDLVVQTEYLASPEADSSRDPERLGRLQGELERRCRTTLGVRTTVKLVEPGTLARTEFKASRVIDNRDLFRELRGGP